MSVDAPDGGVPRQRVNWRAPQPDTSRDVQAMAEEEQFDAR
jgi:hypothetical protein